MPTVRLARELAERQWGVVARRQLLEAGLSPALIRGWLRNGRMVELFSGVYAFGHARLGLEGNLTAALFHAGPGAALSHASAAHWWRLTMEPPKLIEVAVPGWSRSVPGRVTIHHPRRLEVVRHRRLTVTSVRRTLLDLTPRLTDRELRFMLAEAEYLRLLDAADVHRACGRGHPGSERLKRALQRHDPRLAAARTDLERDFFLLCEAAGLPLPEMNAQVSRMRVDALWREQKVAVELDARGHGGLAQLDRDHRRDLTLRRLGFLTLRYSGAQVYGTPAALAGELARILT